MTDTDGADSDGADIEVRELVVEDPVAGTLTFTARVGGPADGEPVVLLHGFPQTSRCWSAVLPALVAAGHRVLAPDQRGYSPGARPAEADAYRTDRLVDDVLALADAVGVERFHLVGHDWGAVLAWRLVVEHPARVRTLAALSVPHPRAFVEGLSGGSDERRDQAKRSSYIDFFRTEGSEDAMLADGAAGLRMLFEGSGMAPGEAAPYLDALATPEALRAALNWYRVGELTLADLDDATVPTLFLWSTEDVAIGRAAAEAAERCVAAPYRFVELEGISHWIPEHAAERVTGELLEWFAAHR